MNNSEKEEASNFIDTNKIPYRINQNCIDVSKYEIARNRTLFLKFYFLVGLILKKFLKLPEIAELFKKNNVNDIKFIIVGPLLKNLDKLKDKIKKLGLDTFFEIRKSINSIEEKKALFREVDILFYLQKMGRLYCY